MPRKSSLKVFRMAIGFHDAYVAAPSRKAALAAWGTSSDLFASKMAEQVVDPDLMREPLAHPGEIIRRSRGTTAEQIAALPPEVLESASRPAKSEAPPAAPKQKAAPPRPPRPDRAALDAAERALADLKSRYHDAQEALTTRQVELDRERRALEKSQHAEADEAAQALDSARVAYDRAMRKWRG